MPVYGNTARHIHECYHTLALQKFSSRILRQSEVRGEESSSGGSYLLEKQVLVVGAATAAAADADGHGSAEDNVLVGGRDGDSGHRRRALASTTVVHCCHFGQNPTIPLLPNRIGCRTFSTNLLIVQDLYL